MQLAKSGKRVEVAKAFAGAFILGCFGDVDWHVNSFAICRSDEPAIHPFEELDLRFELALLSGGRVNGTVKFQGGVRTLADVEVVAASSACKLPCSPNGKV